MADDCPECKRLRCDVGDAHGTDAVYTALTAYRIHRATHGGDA